ncbi:MAG: hypothetical protein ACXVEE_40170 [Polyangiales bacterium]
MVQLALRVVAVTLLVGCSSSTTSSDDAAPIDGAFDGREDAVADDEPPDTSSGTCLNAGDPCVTNMECCSSSCIGVGTSDSAGFQTCQ